MQVDIWGSSVSWKRVPNARLASCVRNTLSLAQLAPHAKFILPARLSGKSSLMILCPANTSLGGGILTHFKGCNDARN